MIIDMNRYNGGGGSGSGVTPAQVQQQIDSALTPYWESGETKDYVDGAVSGISVDLSDYYTSAQTEEAIAAATSGKADAANVTPKTGRNFPEWNAQGIITGSTQMAWLTNDIVNGKVRKQVLSNDSSNGFAIYAPESAGTAGQILVSTGNGAPVWSAVTGPDMSLYTPTSGFSTINGSAITNGGNIVIQGGGDMSGYWNSAETKSYVDSAATNLQDQIDTMDEVIADALVDLNDRVDAVSAATQDMVTSTDVRHMVKLSQAAYDQLSVKDPETFYIIVNE